jgi:hypothetical protein
MKRFFQLSILLCVGTGAFAQSSPYENDVYSPAIKSVEFYNAKKQGSFPIINLNSGEQLFLAFDDLRGGSENYYYTIEHCDGDWNSSNLPITDYLLGPSEDRITDYNYSSATLQKYTHYTLKFPNEIIRPKISGNYILKVYEDDDPAKIVLTRKMYVVNNKMTVGAEVVASQNQDTRQSNQKINFTINYGNLQVQNPNADIRIWIMQNGRDETGVFTTQVQYIRGNQLIYGDLSTNDFPGNNEFRHFDTRSLRSNSDRVSKIIRDTANSVILLADGSRNQPNYTFLYDNDGKFFILNNDGTNPVIDADYAHMYISLDAGKTDADGSAYIVGKFNDYKLDARSKLDYDPRGKFFTHLFLKQGVYDYEYVWVDKATNKPDDTFLEGSYYDTENSYQILVYYKPPAARWEELVAYRGVNTAKKQ